MFAVLAEAEGAVHGIDPDDVELHEVGALDAIVDVVGVAAALHSLGIDAVVASPIAIGHGTVRAAHGDLPNPPPAVARLLAQRNVPVVGVETTMELATPTGVAVLVALADRFGAAAGDDRRARRLRRRHRRPGRAARTSCRCSSARPPSRAATPRPGRAAVQLEVNVDDVTGEVLAHTIAALLAAGAHDAWATPIVMKKGRPAHTVAALVDPADVERLAAVLLAETGSLGVRAATVERWPQQRDEIVVDVDGHPVRVKRRGRPGQARARRRRRAATALGRPAARRAAVAETWPPGRSRSSSFGIGRSGRSRRTTRAAVGSIQVSHLGWRLPGGAELLRDVSFSVGDGDRAALVGANGVGKSTLMRLIAGELTPTSGTLSIDGRLGVMRQLVGVADGVGRRPATVRELLVSLAPPAAAGGRHAPGRRRASSAERRPDGATPTPSPTGATTAATTPRCTGTSA